MSNINNLDYEVWYKTSGDNKPRLISAFNFRFDAEFFIEKQHVSIKDNYYIKDKTEKCFYPNMIF